MSRFSNRALRPAALSIAGLALAGAVVVVAAALPGRASAQPEASAPVPSHAPSAPPQPSAAPTRTPDPTPVPTPVATPVPAKPSATPDDGGTDAIPLYVDLDTFDGHAVSMDVVDHSGWVVAAETGHPGDGASVESNRLEVTNVDARTLRLRWTDFPVANRDALFVDEVGGRLRLVVVQPEHDGSSDAIAFDRELVVRFDRAVDAATVEAIIQGGLDTAG